MPPLLEDTRVRIVSVIAILGAIAAGSWRAATVLGDIRRDLQALTANAYTMDRASEVALRTALENPGQRVPNPRDPSQIIVVTSGRVSGVP
jgi:hypothetical protein